MKTALKVAACAVGLIGALGQMAYADSPPPPPTPPPPAHNSTCINTSQIDHLSYPDNRTILFHMIGGPVKIWRNDLTYECSGLKFEQGIAWSIWGDQVCSNMQVFYVLRRHTPCMLGAFTPYTPPPPPTDAPH